VQIHAPIIATRSRPEAGNRRGSDGVVGRWGRSNVRSRRHLQALDDTSDALPESFSRDCRLFMVPSLKA